MCGSDRRLRSAAGCRVVVVVCAREGANQDADKSVSCEIMHAWASNESDLGSRSGSAQDPDDTVVCVSERTKGELVARRSHRGWHHFSIRSQGWSCAS